jgi:hypothetical protein
VAAVFAWRALTEGDSEAPRTLPRVRASPTPKAATRPPVEPAPTSRPADARTSPLGPDGSEILREAGKRVEELMREERRKAEQKAQPDKKGHGKKKGGG